MTRSPIRPRRTALPRRTPTPRRLTATLAAGALVLGLAACQPIVVDGDTVTSHATRAVSPTTVTVAGKAVAAIEIRLRDCHTLSGAFPDDVGMRPYAFVVDGKGTTIYSDFHLGGPQPAGSKVVPGGTDDAHRTTIPVAGVPTPLTIDVGCTVYPGYGSGGLPTNSFQLPTCTTSNRTCPASKPGQGTYRPS